MVCTAVYHIASTHGLRVFLYTQHSSVIQNPPVHELHATACAVLFAQHLLTAMCLHTEYMKYT